MAKKRDNYQCIECGAEYGKWMGKCTACNTWNTIEKVTDKNNITRKKRPEVEIIDLYNIEDSALKRLDCGIKEFNQVCGGGIVPGSVILIGGEPGIGKSTIALQIANNITSIYISGEESPLQIKERAKRLQISNDKIKLSTCMCVEDIVQLAEAHKPQCLIIDSIQTIFTEEVSGSRGSVSQLRESTAQLIQMAKTENISVLLIGHITKEGSIAGPKVLEHLVDTVLYFEGDFSKDFRILRSFKNRFGSVNELGLFRMTAAGLEEVKEKNEVFLNSFSVNTPGSAISAAREGTRTILFEVQSLVSFTNFSNPRRMADGIDYNRLIILAAVLEKHSGLKLNSFDIFANVSGGFHINETAADLAIAVAIASSLKNKAVPSEFGFLGEISLSGEIRPVHQIENRLKEFSNAEFKRIFLPAGNKSHKITNVFSGEVFYVKHISEVFDFVF